MGDEEFVDLRVVGTAEHPPVLPVRADETFVPDGVVVARPRDLRGGLGDRRSSVDTTWVDGPGAAAAVFDSGLADSPGVTVTQRVEWLTDLARRPP